MKIEKSLQQPLFTLVATNNKRCVHLCEREKRNWEGGKVKQGSGKGFVGMRNAGERAF